MAWLVVIVLGLLVWATFALRRAIAYLRADIMRLHEQLQQVRAAQQETMGFMFHAVDNFALFMGETKDGDEPLSARIQEYRESLKAMIRC